MEPFQFKAEKISKSFRFGKYVFRDISFELSNGGILAVTGDNGSGKTTMLKVLCGALRPDSGEVSLDCNGKNAGEVEFRLSIGYVAPYLSLYEEFTPAEHISLLAGIRGIALDKEKALSLLKNFHLADRSDDPISSFSTGMKQRMKYVLATMHEPKILFLDEPLTNLDSDGISTVLSMILKHRDNGGGIIIATNEERDKALADKIIRLKKTNYS